MKKLTLIFIAVLGIGLMFSCEKKEATPVYDPGQNTAATISEPAADAQFVLTEETADSVMTTFKWSTASYNLDDLETATYSIQVDMPDSNFVNAKELASTTETMYAITVNDMNKVLIGLGYEADVASLVEVRVLSFLSSNREVSETISQVIQITVTPYVTEEPSGPSLWVPGNHQGWAPASAPQIWDTDGDNVFEGFVYFPEDGFNGEFKFTANPDWVDDENYGAGATPGSLDNDSGAGNLLVPGFGGYWLVADLNAMTWSYTAQNWGVIGSGILAGDWTEDVDIIPASGGPLNILVATTDVIEPPDGTELRFKFRADDGWDLNYGADAGSNVLILGGTDIPMPEGPGNYTFKMNMSAPVFTYEFIKN